MGEQYLPVLLQVGFAILFAAAALVFSVILGRAGRRSPIKDSPYECGMRPAAGAPGRFGVKFYLVAMLFILFDLEIVFLYPWAVVFREFVATRGPVIFWSMGSFLTVVTVGYAYALMKGALDWRPRSGAGNA